MHGYFTTPAFVIQISKLEPRRTRTDVQACQLWKEESINYTSSCHIRCSSPAHSTYNVPTAFLTIHCKHGPHYSQSLIVDCTPFNSSNHVSFLHTLRCFMGREERNSASAFSWLLSPLPLYLLLPLSPPVWRKRTMALIHAVHGIYCTVTNSTVPVQAEERNEDVDGNGEGR